MNNTTQTKMLWDIKVKQATIYLDISKDNSKVKRTITDIIRKNKVTVGKQSLIYSVTFEGFAKINGSLQMVTCTVRHWNEKQLPTMPRSWDQWHVKIHKF